MIVFYVHTDRKINNRSMKISVQYAWHNATRLYRPQVLHKNIVFENGVKDPNHLIFKMTF